MHFFFLIFFLGGGHGLFRKQTLVLSMGFLLLLQVTQLKGCSHLILLLLKLERSSYLMLNVRSSNPAAFLPLSQLTHPMTHGETNCLLKITATKTAHGGQAVLTNVGTVNI